MNLDAILLECSSDLVRNHAFFAGLALFGSTLALPLLLGFAARDGRSPRGMLALILGMVVSIGLSVVLQRLGGRLRPEAVLAWWPAPPTPSLPSGHAAAAASLATCWGLLRRKRFWTSVPLAILIACSRVALGHHYPSDAILGAVLGVGTGLACWGWVASGAPWPRRLGWGFPQQAALVVVISGMAWLGFLPRALLMWPGADKVMHAVLFGILVFFATLWTGAGLRLPAVLFGLALVEEVAQRWSPRRTSDPWDLACDLGGMAVCFLLGRWVGWKWRSATPCCSSEADALSRRACYPAPGPPPTGRAG